MSGTRKIPARFSAVPGFPTMSVQETCRWPAVGHSRFYGCSCSYTTRAFVAGSNPANGSFSLFGNLPRGGARLQPLTWPANAPSQCQRKNENLVFFRRLRQPYQSWFPGPDVSTLGLAWHISHDILLVYDRNFLVEASGC